MILFVTGQMPSRAAQIQFCSRKLAVEAGLLRDVLQPEVIAAHHSHV
jgi:hypothetical protein